MNTIDTQHRYATHEAGYLAAQCHGFQTIQRLEDALRERDGWAGRYIGYWDLELEEMVVDGDCSDDYEHAHKFAERIAAEAARGNARGIIIAQGRDDEAALMILAASPSPG
ncbi:hypothetical protein [Sphingomonas sp. BK069]|uniref:hypothetical protein n=1 Tax=Sphingomonas sp. BK069 TaxID=2586979 RepID=UPI001618F56A|nr:hypothetical protein [Sphingomonas sp. BK069]MBB3349834.1 hypothetical protein [Sphingomonas sp. BK069]